MRLATFSRSPTNTLSTSRIRSGIIACTQPSPRPGSSFQGKSKKGSRGQRPLRAGRRGCRDSLLRHPSVDSLHRFVPTNHQPVGPRTTRTQHEKVAVAHFHARHLHGGSVKSDPSDRNKSPPTSSPTSRARDCASALTRYCCARDSASSRHLWREALPTRRSKNAPHARL